MINFIKKAFIPNSECLQEGYMIKDQRIISVVDASHILPVINNFLDVVKEKLVFLFIQVPCSREDESDDCFHDDVYYIDTIIISEAKKIIHEFSDILLNDGMVSFGVGTEFSDEVGKYKYNTVILYSKTEIAPYLNIFKREKIVENKNLISPWELINKDNPGTCEAYTDSNGKTIYDVLEQLKKYGIYKAGQRESK